MGYTAAAFASALAKFPQLAGGQGEALDLHASHVPQTNPRPLANLNEKNGVWDLSSLLTSKELTNNIQ